jgi:hypothetical protein
MQMIRKSTKAGPRMAGGMAKLLACLPMAVVAPSLMLAPSAFAQTNTADILGTVTDPSGGTIPNAKVTLVNTATQDTRTVQTSGDGAFTFSSLAPGNYNLTVTVNGFQSLSAKDLVVAAGDRRRVDAGLKIGGSTETVEVTSSAPVLQTDSSVVASTVTERAVSDLPLNGRNFIALAQLSPGATEGSPTSFSSGTRPDDRRQGSSVAVNGQPDVINNQLIDGLDNNEKVIGTIGVRPSVEAIAEVRVLTNTFTADSGRSAGAVINIITKSGTNNFHGSVFEFFRNDKLNAFPYYGATPVSQRVKPELRQNQFGGSIGGPIWKDKTFFFADLEYFRQVQGTLPTPAPTLSDFERANPGNFSDLLAACNNGKSAQFCVSNPVTGTPFVTGSTTTVYAPSGIVPTADRDSAGLFYLSLFPAQNNGCPTGPQSCQYTGIRTRTQNSRLYDIRIDHRFNAKDSIFGRYSDNDVTTFTPTAPFPIVNTSIGSIDPGSGFAGNSPQTARNIALAYTHVFTEKVLFQFAVAYSYLNNISNPVNLGLNPNTKLGQPGINIDSNTSALAPAVVSQLTTIGNGGNFIPLNDRDNNFQGNGSILWNKGNHSIKIGGALIRRTALELQNNVGQGSWTFAGAPQLASGVFSGMNRNIDIHPPTLQTWEPSGYIQDDWHASSKLTLNLGARYDVYTPYTEKHNFLSNFDYAAKIIRVAGVNGVSRTGGVLTDYSNFSPRIGFAYSVRNGTVIRGGFGLAFFPTNIASSFAMKAQPNTSIYGNCSTVTSIANTSGCQAGFAYFRLGLPAVIPTDAGNPIGSIPSGVDPHFRSGYLEQYNLAVQHQIAGNVLTVTYVGSQGRRLLVSYNINNVVPVNGCSLVHGGCADSSATITTGQRPLSQNFGPGQNFSNITGAITHNASQGASNYNSLQVQVERRFAKGFGYNANYVYARGLDNRPDPSGFTAGGTGQVIATRNINDYANSDIDVRHRSSILLNYAPPFANSFTGFKAVALKGWQINLINVWSTGTPNNVVNPNTGTTCGANIFCVNPGGGADRPNQIGNFHTPGPQTPGTITLFNTTAFQTQTLGTAGNERRNQIYGPHYRHLDASLFKDFKLHENVVLQFRSEFFNVANQTNFYLVAANMTINNAAYGKLNNVSPSYTPRTVQFAAKITF